MPSRLTWTRKGTRRPFRYFDAKGSRIRDPAVIARLDALAIPPAWKDVRIAPTPRAKLQAIGHRQRGAEAVPLPPGLPRAAGGGEVRGADPIRREAARSAARDGRAPDARSARPAPRLRRRDPADQPRVVPRRLRPAHEALADVRRDDAEQVARERPRHARHVPLPRARARCRCARRSSTSSSRTRSARCSPRPGRRLFRYEVEGGLCNLTDRRLNDYVQRVHGRAISRARTSAPGAAR